MTVILYTDGACKTAMIPSKEPGKQRARDPLGMGGWAWWVSDNLWDAGSVPRTTNNRMEMLAVIQGLLTMKVHRTHDRLLIVSDSAYVVNCFADGWYLKWRDNGWRNGAGKEVKNRDLWERLLDLYDEHQNVVSFRHVRGHGRGGVGDAPYVDGNHKADRLAVAARKTLETPEPGGVREVMPDDLPNWMA